MIHVSSNIQNRRPATPVALLALLVSVTMMSGCFGRRLPENIYAGLVLEATGQYSSQFSMERTGDGGSISAFQENPAQEARLGAQMGLYRQLMKMKLEDGTSIRKVAKASKQLRLRIEEYIQSARTIREDSSLNGVYFVELELVISPALIERVEAVRDALDIKP